MSRPRSAATVETSSSHQAAEPTKKPTVSMAASAVDWRMPRLTTMAANRMTVMGLVRVKPTVER